MWREGSSYRESSVAVKNIQIAMAKKKKKKIQPPISVTSGLSSATSRAAGSRDAGRYPLKS